MHLFLSPSNIFSSLITFIFLICTIPSVYATDERHRNCSLKFDCANQRYLGYPFWTQGRAEYCGHPDFKLNCNGESPEMIISSVHYKILKIHESSHTLRLARTDYAGTLCPTNPISSNFSPTLFGIYPDTHLVTLYYDCPDLHINPTKYAGDSDCEGDDRRVYYVTRDLSSPLARDLSSPLLAALKSFISAATGGCRTNVLVPMSDSAIKKVEQSQGNLGSAIDEGFELRWNASNSACDDCAKSSGACGYDPGSGGFICYCADQPHSLTCNSTKEGSSGHKHWIIAVSVAAAVVAVTFLGRACLLIYRRRRRIAAQYKSRALFIPSWSKGTTTTATTTSLSQTTVTLPSSKSDLGSAYFGVHVFSYTELEEATGNFSKELGDGGFGVVYFGVLRDGRAVAVKRLYENTLKRVEQFRNEIDILKSLEHRNLVALYGCTSRHSRELLLVYEYIPNGTLADHLHGNRAKSHPLAWPVRLDIAIETASALAFLHESGVIHRDVKTNNILLDNDFTVKVADFGLSRLFPTDVTHVSTAPQGTPGYLDPEYYQCYQLTEKSDIYSFGVVLIELISAKEAVDITRHRHDINLANMAVNRIQNQKLNELVDPFLGFENDFVVRRMVMSVAELAFRCLQQEKELRPVMEEVVEVLQGIRKEVFGEQRAEIVDICGGDDVGLLKNNAPPPLSPETDKCISSSSTTTKSSF